MHSIEFTNKMKNYELQYWIAHKNEDYVAAMDMFFLFVNDIIGGNVVADVGCGPYGGIFNFLRFLIMYGVDPLWDEYDRLGLSIVSDAITRVNANAENFKLENKANMIFSFNALDHSGDLEKSFHNIMENLVPNGKFYFHIHLRTTSQLNAGHLMAISEEDIDYMLKPYIIERRDIMQTCPLVKKSYRSYIGIVKNANI